MRSRLTRAESPIGLYFFDIDDGKLQRDEEGSDYPTLDAARRAARRFLPEVAREEIPPNCDGRTYTLLVSDADRRPVYRATLSSAGLALNP